MKKYEITYLISDDVTDSEITKMTGKVSGIVSSAKGKVEKEESWGRRKLAYPIDKKEFATYVTIEFEIDPLAVNSVTAEIRMMKEIVRLIAVLVDEKKSKVTLTADDIADAAEIGAVVGGEKSFEAIQGQTKDSYDLMAKRPEADLTDKLMNEEITASSGTPPKAVADKLEDTKPKTDKKVDKKKVKEAETAPTSEAVGVPATSVGKKPAKPKVEKKVTRKKAVEAPKAKEASAKDEADRLTKLDKELDDLLGDDL